MQRLTPTESSVDIEVRCEDQLRINEFSRNNARLVEITATLKTEKDYLLTLDDAEDEISLADAEEEGSIKLMLGESFVNVTEEEAEEYIANKKEEVEKSVSSQQREFDVLTKRQEE